MARDKNFINQDYSQLFSSVPSGIISWRRLATNEKMEKYSNHTSWWQKSNSEENSGCAKGFDHTGLKDISYSDICVTGLSNRSPRGCNKGPNVHPYALRTTVWFFSTDTKEDLITPELHKISLIWKRHLKDLWLHFCLSAVSWFCSKYSGIHIVLKMTYIFK